jgi:hypothetical protein
MKILAQIGGLGNTILGFATVGITAVIFMLILGEFDNMTDTGGTFANAEANEAVDFTMESGSTIASMLPVLALVIIAGYVLASIGIFGGQR